MAEYPINNIDQLDVAFCVGMCIDVDIGSGSGERWVPWGNVRLLDVVIHMCTDNVYRHVYRHVHRHALTGTDVSTDMCTDMCVDMCET